MSNKRKTAMFLISIFILVIVGIVAGINTATVVYHNYDGMGTLYSKTYYAPFGEHTIILDTPAESTPFIFSGWHTDQSLNSETVQTVQSGKTIDIYGSWIADNPDTDFLLPELHITSGTEINAINDSFYCSCNYRITNTSTEDCLSDVTGQIKGRGNSTWEYFDKKPYRIKFDEKHNLFGMGESKNWGLLSNTMDYTLMRNEIALGIGRIVGLPYTPQCQWIHLFYNEKYEGLYLLCELPETGINRIDIEIPIASDDIDINFFIELGGSLNGFSLPSVENAENNWGDYFSCEILYPEDNIITKHQKEYMDAYMQLVNEAILTRNWESIIDLVDIQSFADWFLVNEIVLNADIGWSMFAYKLRGDKLYLGPIWDFDQSCGVSDSCGAGYEAWHPASQTRNSWFDTLLKMDEFQAILSSRWKECLPEIQDFLSDEQKKAVIYEKDIAANFERWPVLGTTSWRMRKEIGNLKTYEDNVEFLFEWLNHRIEWLNLELDSN